MDITQKIDSFLNEETEDKMVAAKKLINQSFVNHKNLQYKATKKGVLVFDSQLEDFLSVETLKKYKLTVQDIVAYLTSVGAKSNRQPYGKPKRNHTYYD